MAASSIAPSSLDLVRDRVASRRHREWIRWAGLRLAALGWLIIAATAVTFVADLLLDLGPVSRLVVWLGMAWLVARLGRKRWWPAGTKRRDTTDWALLVEREQHAPTSLVAALQFSDSRNDDGASPRLKRAVIETVEQAAPSINPLRGFTWHPLPGRVGILLALTMIVMGISITFPAHVSAFGKRMLGREAHYPTRTRIVSLAINGRAVALDGPATSERRVRVPAGAAVRFEVQAEGELPVEGAVSLTGQSSGTTRVELSRGEPGTASYQGQFESLDSPRSGTIQLGDARSPHIELVPIPRPVLTTFLEITPPAYARHNAPPAPAPGARTAAVLPGSTVGLSIRSEEKPLREVAVELFAPTSSSASTSKGERERLPLQPGEDRKTWRLDPTGTPLARVEYPLAFRVIAIDDDGLSPAREMTGLINLREDHPPRAAAEASVALVLPTARPTLRYSADDEFGVASMAARITLRRGGTAVSETVLPLPVMNAGATSISGKHELELSGLEPHPGDTIEIVVEATDERGSRPGNTDRAEPVVLTVTDRAGLFVRLREADEASARKLDAIIQQQLGIGDQP